MASKRPYDYPVSNSKLAEIYKMEPFQGNFFKETYRSPLKISNGFVPGTPERNMHTLIFYLMTPEGAQGTIQRHLSDCLHFHHQGRARLQMLKPEGVEIFILGPRADLGERQQVLVPAGVYKVLSLPPEDVELARKTNDKETIGCLISEVVVPGFDFADHAFPSIDDLRVLWKDNPDRDALIADFEPIISPLAKQSHGS